MAQVRSATLVPMAVAVGVMIVAVALFAYSAGRVQAVDVEGEAQMDEVQKMLIERVCERLAIAYTHNVDFGEAERVADLFAEDGVWESGNARYEGREEIRKAFRARQEREQRVSRHVCTNFALTAIDETTAEGVIYLQLYRHDDDPKKLPRPLEGQPVVAGEYHDKYVLTAEGWRFAHRKIEVPFVR